MKTFTFLLAAEDEVAEAYAFYNDRAEGLGGEIQRSR